MGVLSSMGAGNNSWSRNHSVVVVVVVVFLEKRCSNWKNWKKNFVISSHDHYLMNVTTQLDMCNWVNQVNQVLKGAPPLWGRHGGGDGLPLPHPATATTTKKKQMKTETNPKLWQKCWKVKQELCWGNSGVHFSYACGQIIAFNGGDLRVKSHYKL